MTKDDIVIELRRLASMKDNFFANVGRKTAHRMCDIMEKAADMLEGKNNDHDGR